MPPKGLCRVGLDQGPDLNTPDGEALAAVFQEPPGGCLLFRCLGYPTRSLHLPRGDGIVGYAASIVPFFILAHSV